jgi:hypothetical protein
MTLRQRLEADGRTTHDIGLDAARAVDGPEATYTGERPVTLDVDDATRFDVLRAYYGLRAAGCDDVEVRVSAGGSGVHVRGWVSDDVDPAGVEAMRLTHGDHARRTFMDRAHALKPQQVCFSRKPDGDAGEWYRDPEPAIRELVKRSERGPWP